MTRGAFGSTSSLRRERRVEPRYGLGLGGGVAGGGGLPWFSACIIAIRTIIGSPPRLPTISKSSVAVCQCGMCPAQSGAGRYGQSG
jgi:hypothetical protein